MFTYSELEQRFYPFSIQYVDLGYKVSSHDKAKVKNWMTDIFIINDKELSSLRKCHLCTAYTRKRKEYINYYWTIYSQNKPYNRINPLLSLAQNYSVVYMAVSANDRNEQK